MKALQYIKQRLAAPTYRTKLFVFAVVGVALFVIALKVQNQIWHEILLNFSVTFLAVFLIQAVWGLVGGDPIETKIDAIQRSMTLIEDLNKNGIERVWPNRRTWERDNDMGLEAWQSWVCQAKEVCIVSNTFWNNWLHPKPDDKPNDTFVDRFFKNITERSASVRLLLYHPNSYIQRLRKLDEPGPENEMQGEIVESLKLFAEKFEAQTIEQKEKIKQRQQIRLTYKFLHYAQLIRADDRMLVALYLSGKSGSPSPTMQLLGFKSKYFLTYNEQFEILWERGMPLDLANIPKSLNEFAQIPPPPIDGFGFPANWIDAFEKIPSPLKKN